MNILILRLSSMGDIILTQPICAILQKHYPGCNIDYLCKEEFKELPEMFAPPVHPIIYQKKLKFHLRFWRKKYDIVIDLHSKFATYLIMLFMNSPVKVRYCKKRRYRKRIVKGDQKAKIFSTVDLYASALQKMGINEQWHNPCLQINKSELSNSALVSGKADINTSYKSTNSARIVRQECQDIKPIKIAIFPSANHFTKRYPVSCWIQLINTHPQYCFTLLGSNTDKEICDNIHKHCPGNCINLCSSFSFPELYAELEGYNLIISGDTGPMHLAATLNKPQIAIFGGTHPRLGFKPLNNAALILCADLPCQPCSLHGREKCPQGHFNCMNSITPALIGAAIKKALSY